MSFVLSIPINDFLFSKILWKVFLSRGPVNGLLSWEGLLNVFSLQNTCERVSISKRPSFWDYVKILSGLHQLVCWRDSLASSPLSIEETHWPPPAHLLKTPPEFFSTSSSDEKTAWYTLYRLLVSIRSSVEETSWPFLSLLLKDTLWLPPARLLRISCLYQFVYWDSLASSSTIETHWLPAGLLRLPGLHLDYCDSLPSSSSLETPCHPVLYEDALISRWSIEALWTPGHSRILKIDLTWKTFVKPEYLSKRVRSQKRSCLQ